MISVQITNGVGLKAVMSSGLRRKTKPKPELMTNYDFTQGSTGWTAIPDVTFDAKNNTCTIGPPAKGSKFASISQAVLTGGKTYNVEIDVLLVAKSGNYTVTTESQLLNTITANGVTAFRFTAGLKDTRISLDCSSLNPIIINSFSIKEA